MYIPYEQFASLLSMATLLRANTAVEAHGRCFSLSLDLCAQAIEQDISLDLIVWKVTDDEKFLEHWAVLIEETRVIDLSRAQIDSQGGLIFDVHDDPENFHSPRVYPARLLIPPYVLATGSVSDQLAPRFIWESRLLLFKHDLLLAIQTRNLKLLLSATGALAQFCAIYPLNLLFLRLHARTEKLMKRLDNS